MLVGCPDCGTVQLVPALIRRGSLVCRRCARTLERATGRSLDAALALSAATLLLLFPANMMTLFHLSFAGIERSSRLGSGVFALWQGGWILLALGVALQGILLPFARFGLLTAALAAVRLQRRDVWPGMAFRWAERLDHWAMPDVFLIGAAIGYSRVAARLPLQIEAGGWCLILAAFMAMLTRGALDRRATWDAIQRPADIDGQGATLMCPACDLVLPADAAGSRCPRCRKRLYDRRPSSLMQTTALIAAGYLLYPVANWFPMSVDLHFGQTDQHTILSGVMRLFQAGLWPLGVLIFCTSIAIPLLKLVGMTWLILGTYHGSTRWLVLKTRLYRVIGEIGRWSNVDVFTIAIFVPLMQINGYVSVRAGLGAPAFLAVVVLTMFAVRCFDPRLMWDRARP
ncbi:MAG: paraquat-inducible protein A [Acetobacteraceae bacterium]